jgi:biotin operon repressor
MQNKSIEIRDLRQQDWLWTSKQLLFHPKIDGNNYKVYGGLAAYANNSTQEAFPSIETLSEKLHMSRNTVIKSISILQANNFIKIEKTKGEHNIYTLLGIPHITEDVKVTEAPAVTTPKEKEEPKQNYAESVFDKFFAL